MLYEGFKPKDTEKEKSLHQKIQARKYAFLMLNLL